MFYLFKSDLSYCEPLDKELKIRGNSIYHGLTKFAEYENEEMCKNVMYDIFESMDDGSIVYLFPEYSE